MNGNNLTMMLSDIYLMTTHSNSTHYIVQPQPGAVFLAILYFSDYETNFLHPDEKFFLICALILRTTKCSEVVG